MFICSCQCTNSSDGAGVLHAPQDYVFTSSRVSSLLLFALLPHLNPSPHLPGVRDTVGVLSIFPWLAAFMGTLAESYVTGGQSREEQSQLETLLPMCLAGHGKILLSPSNPQAITD